MQLLQRMQQNVDYDIIRYQDNISDTIRESTVCRHGTASPPSDQIPQTLCYLLQEGSRATAVVRDEVNVTSR